MAAQQQLGCNPLELQSAGRLTFRQEACFYAARLYRPSVFARAALSAAWSDVRNSPHLSDSDGIDGFARRLGVFYARRASQSSGEFLAGYLNHEDPRYHASLAHGFRNRAKAAFLSVLVATNADGVSRPALSPVAGAFGSGLMSVACYRTHNTWDDGFRRTGISYGGYFGTAFMREFQPDLSAYASRLLHRHKQD